MNVRQAARYVLPPIVADAARQLLPRRELRRHSPARVSTYYALAPWWTRPKAGSATFDFDVANRPVDWELRVPVVRDNLEALALIASPDGGLRLLDFGCSNGHYKLILAANHHTRTWQYVGMDLPAQIDFCRRTYPETVFHAVDEGWPLPCGEDEFDVVLASSVIQYLREPIMALGELQRVTRAYVLVSRLPTWKYQPSRFLVQHLRAAAGEERYPLQVFNRRAIEEAFQKTGLTVVFRDSGSEHFSVPGIPEPVGHMLYLLKKARPT